MAQVATGSVRGTMPPLEQSLHGTEERILAAIRRKRAMRDASKLHQESLTLGQRIADGVAATMGSWPFIIGQSIVLAAWIVLNVTELIFRAWDPYPFILLNLMLSFQAAYAVGVFRIPASPRGSNSKPSSPVKANPISLWPWLST